MSNTLRRIKYVDDDTESVNQILQLRLPPLLIGLALGFLVSFITSRFEEVLAHNVQVAFFLPLVVYIASAIGTQTEAIYSRDLKSGKARFHSYLVKETLLGLLVGGFFGAVSALITALWLGNNLLAVSVGIAMCVAVATAPLVALITTELMQDFREDPAAGAGPIATVIQDALSIVIYGFVCSMILL